MFRKLIQALKGGPTGNNSNERNATAAEPVIYKDITITPTPLSEGGQYKTAGTISQIIDGEEKRTEFIRADNHSSLDAAVDHTVNKAKQIIDERGAALFNSERC